MTTNKTPIQALIALVFQDKSMVDKWELLGWLNEQGRQKEKAFAFDCFEAGKRNGIDYCLSIDDGMPTMRPSFDEFYSQYNKQEDDIWLGNFTNDEVC